MAQVAPDQASHLDALIGGILVLLNMMPGMAYVGVHLNSGGCIHALKNLVRRDYKEFSQQFELAVTVDGRRLQDAMKGRSYQEKLDTAWELYACEELAKLGFTKTFKRVYVELEEFEMFLGSMAVFHFVLRSLPSSVQHTSPQLPEVLQAVWSPKWLPQLWRNKLFR